MTTVIALRAANDRSCRLEALSRGHLDAQEPRRVAAEDRPSRRVIQPGGAFDEAHRVGLAHIRRIVGADQDMIGAELRDEYSNCVCV